MAKKRRRNTDYNLNEAITEKNLITEDEVPAEEPPSVPVLIIAFTSDNHLSNVKMIQSIFKQDYKNIELVVCNDNTPGFQSERFFYNLMPGRTDNIRHIYFHQNKYPIGEMNSFAKIKDTFKSEFIYILHSGEYFTANDTISRCVMTFNENPDAGAIVAKAELWTDDLKKCTETITYSENDFVLDKIIDNNSNKNKDCLFVYRTEAIADDNLPNNYASIYLNIISHLENNKREIVTADYAISKYSALSIKER